MNATKKTLAVHFIFQCLLITFLSGLSPVLAEIYHWTDEDGVLHLTDDLGKVPEEQRGKVNVFETKPDREGPPEEGPPEEGPVVEPPPAVEVEELYDGMLLSWWEKQFQEIRKSIAGVEGAYTKKKQFVEVFEAGRRFGQVYEERDIETYERYKKEIPEDEEMLEGLAEELEELQRKARSAGVPKKVRGE